MHAVARLHVLRVLPGPQKAMYQRKIAQLSKEGKLNDIDIYTMYARVWVMEVRYRVQSAFEALLRFNFDLGTIGLWFSRMVLSSTILALHIVVCMCLCVASMSQPSFYVGPRI